jgi:hypothetical protein
VRRIYNVIGTIDGEDGIGLHGRAKRWAETLADWHRELGFDTFSFWPTATPTISWSASLPKSSRRPGTHRRRIMTSPSPHRTLRRAVAVRPSSSQAIGIPIQLQDG